MHLNFINTLITVKEMISLKLKLTAIKKTLIEVSSDCMASKRVELLLLMSPASQSYYHTGLGPALINPTFIRD